MENKKKISSRKIVAFGFGVAAIAGLSIASAAQLTVEEESPLVGVSDTAATDSAVVNVSYGNPVFSDGVFTTNEVTITFSDSALDGRTVDAWILDDAGVTVVGGELSGGTVDGDNVVFTGVNLNSETIYDAAIAVH